MRTITLFTCAALLMLLSYNSSLAQLTAYTHKKQISIDNAIVSGVSDLTNFPVLISFTDPDLQTIANGGNVTNSNGYDIVFTASDGSTLLDHELEKYDATTGEYIAWVRIPTLSASAPTDIYIFYGNSDISTDPSSASTWDSGYGGVWHLDEKASGIGTTDLYEDGTSNANHGGDTITATGSSGKIGLGQEFDQTSGDYINSGRDASLNITTAVTMEAWVYMDTWPAEDDWYNVGGKQEYSLYLGRTKADEVLLGADFSINGKGIDMWDKGSAIIPEDTWTHVVVTFDGEVLSGYVNGVFDWEKTDKNWKPGDPGTIDDSSDNDLLIGQYTGEEPDMNFHGFIDELRVSNVARSADWIATEFNNQNNPAGYTSVGPQVVNAAPGNVSGNLTLWFMAGSGVKSGGDQITSGAADEWENASGNIDFTEILVGNGTPTMSSNGSNYNPAVYFDGTDDKFQKDNFDADVLFSSQNNTFFFVFEMNTEVGTDVLGGWESDASGDRAAYFENASGGLLRTDVFGDGSKTMLGDNDIRDTWVISTVVSSSSGRELYVDRQLNDSKAASSMTVAGNLGHFALGSRPVATDYYADFNAGEMIVYNTNLSATDIDKVESYLAMKYGITLPGDYIATDGSTIWSTDATYQNDITVIGRDNDEKFYQKQSRSSDDSLKVYINTLAADNASNTGTIANDVSYLVIGHNGDPLYGDIQETPPGIYSKFLREWKVVNTNFDDTYSIEFEWEELGAFNIDDVRLLVDTDGDFSNADTLGVSAGLTFTEGSIIVSGIGTSHIPAGSTRYITLGSVNPSTPLPIELALFEANATEFNDVELVWKTATETNNDFFTIERSKDGTKWATVMEVAGAGNSSTTLEYAEIDEDPYSGISYYRLKQTDFDGQFSYSDIRVVDVDGFSTGNVKIYPNPGYEQVTLEGNLVELSEFRIFDVLGNEVSGNVTILDRIHSEMILDISALRTGVYSIKTKSTIQKLVKR